MNPERIRHLITKIEVEETASDENKIYIDFHDANRSRWYVMFLVTQRGFGVARRILPDGSGGQAISSALRAYLISIIPPDIIARCTAAALVVSTR